MVDDQILEAFEDCLARLQAGASLEQVLALYPALETGVAPDAARCTGCTPDGCRHARSAGCVGAQPGKIFAKANQMAAGRSRAGSRIPAWRFALVL